MNHKYLQLEIVASVWTLNTSDNVGNNKVNHGIHSPMLFSSDFQSKSVNRKVEIFT